MNIISSDNSILVTNPDTCDFDIQVNPSFLVFDLFKQNSSSITLSGTGASSLSKLTAALKLSTNPDNILSIDGTGLLGLASSSPNTDEYVKIDGSDTTAGHLASKLVVGSNLSTTVLNVAGNEQLRINFTGNLNPNIVVNTTTSLVLTGNGSSGTPLSGNIPISAVAGNIISILSDGLYAIAPAFSGIATTDSTSIALTGIGTTGSHLVATSKISATGGNAVTVNSDGLYVATVAAFTGIATTNTSTIIFTGNGTSGSHLSAVANVSATGGNIITTNSDGLYVATQAVVTANNGLTKTGNNIQLGGTLIQHTQVIDNTNAYDHGFSGRRFLFGDLTALDYAGVNAQYGLANKFLIASDAQLINGSTGNNTFFVASQINLTADGGSASGGKTYGNTLLSGVYNVNSNYSVAVKDLFGGTTSFTILQGDNGFTYNANVTDGSAQVPLSNILSYGIRSTTASTSTITHYANYTSLGVYNDGSSTGLINITNFYHLYLKSRTDKTSGITNRYGVYQASSGDTNVFKGDILYYAALTNASDQRIKENVVNYTSGLDAINAIRTVEYNYISAFDDGKKTKRVGVIAQELQAILPEAVSTIKTDTFDDFRTVEANTLIYVLVNAVKTLSQQVTALTAQVQALQPK